MKAFMRIWDSMMGDKFAVLNISGISRETAEGFLKACGSQDDAGERIVAYMDEYVATSAQRIKEKQ